MHRYGKLTTVILKIRKPDFRTRRTKRKIGLTCRLEKNQRTNLGWLYQQQPSGQHSVGRSPIPSWEKTVLQIRLFPAYHCLQMADQKTIERLAFNFASRIFAYKRPSCALSAFSSSMREYLHKVFRADQCAQNVDDIGIAANSPTQLIQNIRAVFECIRKTGLKLII